MIRLLQSLIILILFNAHTGPWRTFLILEMRKLRLKEENGLAQGHIVGLGQNQALAQAPCLPALASLHPRGLTRGDFSCETRRLQAGLEE